MHRSERKIHNPGSEDMRVIIEPHGDVLTLAPGAALNIVAEGAQAGEIELVSADPQTVTIYTWPSSTCTVYQGGQAIRDYSFPVPGLPKGKTTRAFVDLMFRDEQDNSK